MAAAQVRLDVLEVAVAVALVVGGLVAQAIVRLGEPTSFEGKLPLRVWLLRALAYPA
jgi:hypothetical protein